MKHVQVGEIWVDMIAVDPTVEVILAVDLDKDNAKVAQYSAPDGEVICHHVRHITDRAIWEKDGLVCVTSAEDLIRTAKDERR